MDEGQIAVNFSATDPFLSTKDSAGAVRRITGVHQGNTAPATLTAGVLWLDTTRATSPVLKIYDGTNWLVAGSSSALASGVQPTGPVKGDLWVDTSGPSPIVKVYTGTTWTPVDSVVGAATTSAAGISQLATAADVTAGVSDRVVTADLLKTTNDAITAAAGGGGATNVAGTAPVVVTSTGTTRTISVSPASSTDAGVIRLATTAEITAGTATDLAVNPAQLRAVKDSVTTLVGAAVTGVTGHAPITATATGSDIDLTFDPIPLTLLP
jgi:hypothetical protein